MYFNINTFIWLVLKTHLLVRLYDNSYSFDNVENELTSKTIGKHLYFSRYMEFSYINHLESIPDKKSKFKTHICEIKTKSITHIVTYIYTAKLCPYIK